MFRFLLRPLQMLAALGLALGLAVHVAACTGAAWCNEALFWGLHAGAIAIWIPAGLAGFPPTRWTGKRRTLGHAMQDCPAWMRQAVYGLAAYAVLSFLVSIRALQEARPPAPGLAPVVVRAFSGHWMFFYGAAFAVLHSAAQPIGRAALRRCPRGHAVPPGGRTCPDCGSPCGEEARRTPDEPQFP